MAKQDNTVGYSICKEGNQYIVHYNSKSEFFNAIGTLEVGINKSIKPYFSKIGIMIDCARNGVPNIKWLKRFIITIAFSGYNYLGLYFEDCLEVEGEKLFGYMRGRFTKEEIKEIVAFADNFGVEIVPYIQTLAHLQRLFNHWYPYVDEMKDVFDIIMVDEPRTYTMIENVIKTCSKCFSSRRIHIGMDEAPLMLLGNYRNKHGNVDRAEVFSRHVRKVCDICQKYGFEPSAWADMFEHYGVNGKLELPPNLTLNSWLYYLKSSKEYKEKFALSEKLTNKISFASGAWTWVGYAPLNEYTLCTSLPAVKALKGRVNDFCVTTWGDDGSECPRMSVFGSLLEVVNYSCEKGLSRQELAKKAMFLTGYSIKELFALDLPNKVFDCKMDSLINVSKYVLFLDLFMGVRDKSENICWREYFAKNKKILQRLAKRESPIAYIFKMMANLCGVCEIKCGVFSQLRTAYENKDREKIIEIAKIAMPKIIKAVRRFKDSEESAWLIENKPLGIETQNIRLGGLISRLEFIKKTLDRYISGEIKNIVELEQKDESEPLAQDKYNGAGGFNSYEMNVTYCALVHRPLA